MLPQVSVRSGNRRLENCFSQQGGRRGSRYRLILRTVKCGGKNRAGRVDADCVDAGRLLCADPALLPPLRPSLRPSDRTSASGSCDLRGVAGVERAVGVGEGLLVDCRPRSAPRPFPSAGLTSFCPLTFYAEPRTEPSPPPSRASRTHVEAPALWGRPSRCSHQGPSARGGRWRCLPHAPRAVLGSDGHVSVAARRVSEGGAGPARTGRAQPRGVSGGSPGKVGGRGAGGAWFRFRPGAGRERPPLPGPVLPRRPRLLGPRPARPRPEARQRLQPVPRAGVPRRHKRSRRPTGGAPRPAGPARGPRRQPRRASERSGRAGGGGADSAGGGRAAAGGAESAPTSGNFPSGGGAGGPRGRAARPTAAAREVRSGRAVPGLGGREPSPAGARGQGAGQGGAGRRRAGCRGRAARAGSSSRPEAAKTC